MAHIRQSALFPLPAYDSLYKEAHLSPPRYQTDLSFFFLSWYAFILQLKVDEAKQRSDFGEERYEAELFQKKVASVFEKIAERDWKIIDATKSIEDIHEVCLVVNVDVRAYKLHNVVLLGERSGT